jgi:hypothetical protein
MSLRFRFKHRRASTVSFFQPFVTLLAFYDGPTPPPGMFDDFLNIPATLNNLKTRDYLGLVQSGGPDTGTGGHRSVSIFP